MQLRVGAAKIAGHRGDQSGKQWSRGLRLTDMHVRSVMVFTPRDDTTVMLRYGPGAILVRSWGQD